LGKGGKMRCREKKEEKKRRRRGLISFPMLAPWVMTSDVVHF
jgi:hypothetical protein